MKRGNLVWGAILILLGIAFLLFQLFPDLTAGFTWQWILILIGGIFVVASLLSRIGGLMIPGAILLGLAAIFVYQERSGNWESWAYVWALIPGFVGVGMFIGSLYDPEMRPARGASLIIMLISVILFAVFGGVFGLTLSILQYWPVLLILIGGWILLRALRAPRREEKIEEKTPPEMS